MVIYCLPMRKVKLRDVRQLVESHIGAAKETDVRIRTQVFRLQRHCSYNATCLQRTLKGHQGVPSTLGKFTAKSHGDRVAVGYWVTYLYPSLTSAAPQESGK